MAVEVTIGDFVTLQRGTTYKGSLVGHPGPALLGLGAIQPGGGFRIADFKTYGGECPDKLMLFPGDLFVSLKGATKLGDMIGSVARVPTTVPCGRLTQDTVKLEFRKPNSDFERYFYWLLRTPQYREYCAARATGSAVVALSRDDFLAYPVPPLSMERLNLVRLLDAIEAKLDVFRRINTTMEAIAQAIFKSWFLNFDPVKAKAEGREPEGMDGATAALFPSEFEDGELGPIPKHWRKSNLGEMMRIQGGTQPPASEFQNTFRTGYTRLLQIRDFANDNHVTYVPKRPNLRLVGIDDVLIGRYGSGSGDVKKDSLGRLLRGLEGAINVAIVKVIPAKPIYREWLATYVGSGLFYRSIVGGSARAVQAGFRQEDLAFAKVALAPDNVIIKFDEFAKLVWERKKTNSKQIETLTDLRNALLPKLNSGQIRIPEAEALVRA